MFLTGLLALSASVHATDFGVAFKAAISRDQEDRNAIDNLPADSIWGGARDNNWAVMQKHLEAGVFIDAPAPIRKALTPLILALKFKHLDAVAELLKKGANPNQRDEDDFSALYYAFGAGIGQTPEKYDTRFLALLLKYGADPYSHSKYREPVMLNVAKSKEARAIEFLLKQGLEVDRAYGEKCQTALSVASFETMGLLLKAGANPNTVSGSLSERSEKFLTTPLRDASQSDSVRFEAQLSYNSHAKEKNDSPKLELLLRSGANPRMVHWSFTIPRPRTLRCVSGGLTGWADLPEEDNENYPRGFEKILYQNASKPKLFDALLRAAAPIEQGEIHYSAVYTTVRFSLRMVRNSIDSVQDSIRKGYRRPHNDEDWLPYTELLDLLKQQEQYLNQSLSRLFELGTPFNPPVRLENGSFDNYWKSDRFPSLLEDEKDDELFERWLAQGASPFILNKNGDGLFRKAIQTGNVRRLKALGQHMDLAMKIAPWCQATLQQLISDTIYKKDAQLIQVSQSLVRQLMQSQGCQQHKPTSDMAAEFLARRVATP